MKVSKIGVYGGTHLATVVTGALVKAGYRVAVADRDEKAMALLAGGGLPVFEPGLGEVLKEGSVQGRLSFSANIDAQFKDVDFVYFARDATKTADGIDFDEIAAAYRKIASVRSDAFLLATSSQLPVGSSVQLRTMINVGRANPVRFAVIPEFLRLGAALDLFLNQAYTVIGCEDQPSFDTLSEVFSHFSKNIFRMGLGEAEMAKHLANIFVATSVSLVSEFTKVADHLGIDLLPVGKALRFDQRVGQKAYVLPGLGFSGGNLERDIKVLQKKLAGMGETSPLLDAVVSVNDRHNDLVSRRLDEIMKEQAVAKVAFLGVTYKPFTDTLAGSLTLEAGQKLVASGIRVSAYDPMVSKPAAYTHAGMEVAASVGDCLRDADIAVLMIEKPQFRDLTIETFTSLMKGRTIMDAANLLDGRKFKAAGFRYCAIGRGLTW